jgi:CDGSH-type Zn-finger protein
VNETPGKKYWCACGHSKNQPYCDGAHARVGSDLRPVPVEITEARRVAWCGCKKSAKAPYCDGSHNRLA